MLTAIRHYFKPAAPLSTPSKVSDIYKKYLKCNTDSFSCINKNVDQENSLDKIKTIFYEYNAKHTYEDIIDITRVIKHCPSLDSLHLDFSNSEPIRLKQFPLYCPALALLHFYLLGKEHSNAVHFFNSPHLKNSCNIRYFYLGINGEIAKNSHLVTQMVGLPIQCNSKVLCLMLGDYTKENPKNIFDVCLKPTSIEEFNLYCSNLDEDMAQRLKAVFANKACNIKYFNTEHVKLGDDTATSIANILKTNSSIKKIKLFYSKLKSQNISKIFNALASNHSLDDMRICLSDECGNSCGQAFEKAVRCGIYLKKLVLACVDMTDEGIYGIARALSDEKCTLEKLDIGESKATPPATLALLQAIANNKIFKALKFGTSNTNAAISNSIIDIIKKNRIIKLELWNLFGTSAPELGAILNALKTNSTLHSFIVRDNGSGPQFRQFIYDRFAQVKNLAELNMISHFIPCAMKRKDAKKDIEKRVDHILHQHIKNKYILFILSSYFKRVFTRTVAGLQKDILKNARDNLRQLIDGYIKDMLKNSASNDLKRNMRKEFLNASACINRYFDDILIAGYYVKPRKDLSSNSLSHLLWGDCSALHRQIEDRLHSITTEKYEREFFTEPELMSDDSVDIVLFRRPIYG